MDINSIDIEITTCPKCGGRLLKVEIDTDGVYLDCLCGYNRPILRGTTLPFIPKDHNRRKLRLSRAERA